LDSLTKKLSLFGGLTLLAIIVVSIVGCSSGSSSPTQTTIPPTTFQVSSAPITSQPAQQPTKSTATSSAPATSSQPSGGTLGDILGRVSGVASMKYDMVTTTSSLTSTASMWVKKTKIRMETTQQGQNVVMLINGDTKIMYMYTPAQNTAVKLDFSQAPKSALDNSNSILQYAPTVIGTETLDGKVCQVIQYTANAATTKAWIWIDKGLPVRVQATTSQGTSTTDFKNYDFSDIPDSMFDLPAGVQMMGLGLPPGMPPGMPTNLPSGLPTNLPTGYPTNIPYGR
jgi:hypothetical protein